MRTRGYHVQQWWSFDGTYAVWRDLRWGISLLVWRGKSHARANELCASLNSAMEDAR